MPVGVISMPPFQRQETLPERPGDSPERLMASAVSITARRAFFSASLLFSLTANHSPQAHQLPTLPRLLLQDDNGCMCAPLGSGLFLRPLGVERQQALARRRADTALGDEAGDQPRRRHVE